MLLLFSAVLCEDVVQLVGDRLYKTNSRANFEVSVHSRSLLTLNLTII